MSAAGEGYEHREARWSIWQLIAVVLLASLGQTASYVSPFTQVALVKAFGIDELRASMAISAETASLALCVLVISRSLLKLNFRAVALLAALAAVAGQLVTLAATQYHTLLIARALCGLGEGGFVAIAYAVMARAKNPVRLFSIQAICLALLLFIIFACLPWIESVRGPRGQFFAFALIAGLTVPLALFVKQPPIPAASSVRLKQGKSRTAQWTLSVACVIALGSASNALWLHYQTIGELRKIDEHTIFLIPAVGGVAMLALPLVAMKVFHHARACWPLAVASFLQILTTSVYLFGPAPIAFIASATGLNALIGFQLVYARLWAAAIDPSGEVVSGVGGGDFAGAFLGPLIGGAFAISTVNNGSLFAATVALFVVSAILALMGDRRIAAELRIARQTPAMVET